jgi:hypothetical protein
MDMTAQPTEEYKEVNKLRKKSQLKNAIKKKNLGLLSKKSVILLELCIVVGSDPRT